MIVLVAVGLLGLPYVRLCQPDPHECHLEKADVTRRISDVPKDNQKKNEWHRLFDELEASETLRHCPANLETTLQSGVYVEIEGCELVLARFASCDRAIPALVGNSNSEAR